MVVRCCLTEHLNPDAVARAADLLSVEERARHNGFRFLADRRDFALAHALLRRTLASRGGRAPSEWTFVPGPSGKPQLPHGTESATNFSFNLAHTRGLVACALSVGGEVGVDVEALDDRLDVLQLARRHFSRHEVFDLESREQADRTERFVEYWVLKEAYLKATGSGLSAGLDEMTFALNEPSTIRFALRDRDESSCWRFALFAPSTRHRLAVAVRNPHAAHLAARVVEPDAIDRGRDLAPLRSS